MLRVGTPHEIATEVSINTAFGVERVVRDAFGRARKRPRKKLTLVHKTNVLIHAGDLWRGSCDEVAAEFPDVTVDYLHVDAATIFMVTDPGRFDVIVTDNLFGDIITDLAAAIAGGIGLAASGNINPERHVPSMFEPVHGSAPGHRRVRARPTRRPPSCRWRCCSTTSATADAAAGRGRRSPPIWPERGPAAHVRDRRRLAPLAVRLTNLMHPSSGQTPGHP